MLFESPAVPIMTMYEFMVRCGRPSGCSTYGYDARRGFDLWQYTPVDARRVGSAI